MVVTDGFKLLLGDVRTGKIQATVPVKDLKWGLRLNAGGPLSAVLRPASRELARHDLNNLTASRKQFLAVEYGVTVLEAGPIWSRGYDPDTGDLTINGLGLWSIFDRRKNVPGAALNPAVKATEASYTVANKHLGSIGREMVRRSLQDNYYAAGDLPVVLPADIAGTESRTYYGYNLAWIGDDLRELTKAANGPDFRFRPRRRTDDPSRLEWVMEHGAVDILQQVGPDWRWDARVERTGVTKLGVNQDGTETADMVWTPGSGQEQAMRLATARSLTLVTAGYPWTEAEESAGSEEDLGVLQSVSNRKMADVSRPWDTWSLSVRADVNPTLGKYLPGDWANVNVPDNHPILPAGRIRVRILAVDGDGKNDVKLSVAPIQGSV